MNVCQLRVEKQNLFFLTKWLLEYIILYMTFLIDRIQSGLFCQVESLWNKYICLTNFTKLKFCLQLLISSSSPLQQVVYPSSKFNRTTVAKATWQTQNYHMIYI